MEGVRKHSLLAGVVLLVAGFVTFEFLPERPEIHLAVLGLGGVVLALGLFWNRAAVVELVRGRAVRSAAAAAGYSAAVLAIWVLVNWLGTRHHHRFDFTEEGVFTLDARTVAELQRIDRPLEVIAFVADADEASRQRIRDLLEEYRYHQDRITYRFVDPFKNPGEVEQHQVTEANTLILRSGDQTTKVVGLEEEKITGAINKVRVDRKKTVYFTRGHGEREIDDFQPRGTSNVRDALTGLQYEVKSVQLAQE
ncbi:MAG: Gldg family protein, partial [Acidobacteria bacterium]|nr:Gldg family protein [Acidobacteriota bacterium]